MLKIFNAVLIGAVVITPLFSFAQTTTDSTKEFCRQLVDKDVTLETITSKEQARLNDSFGKIKNIIDQRTIIDNGQAEKATEMRQESSANFQKLLSGAKNKEETAALVKFQDDIQAASLAREETIKSAIMLFRKNLDTSLKTATTSIQAAFEDYKDDVETALGMTKTNCDNGIAGIDAENGLKESVKTARKEFSREVKRIQGKQNLQALVTVRLKAIATANENFSTSLNTILNNLKKTYPNL